METPINTNTGLWGRQQKNLPQREDVTNGISSNSRGTLNIVDPKNPKSNTSFLRAKSQTPKNKIKHFTVLFRAKSQISTPQKSNTSFQAESNTAMTPTLILHPKIQTTKSNTTSPFRAKSQISNPNPKTNTSFQRAQPLLLHSHSFYLQKNKNKTKKHYLTGVQDLIGRSQRKVEEVGDRSAGDVEHSLHPQGHLIPLLHGVGGHVQLLLRAHDNCRLAILMTRTKHTHTHTCTGTREGENDDEVVLQLLIGRIFRIFF